MNIAIIILLWLTLRQLLRWSMQMPWLFIILINVIIFLVAIKILEMFQ